MSDNDKNEDLRQVDAGLAETVAALNALPAEAAPPRDLWPEIQARIAAERQPRHLGIASTDGSLTHKSWWSHTVSIPWAIAASLLLASAIGLGTWQLAQTGSVAQVASDDTTSEMGELGESGESGVLRTVADDFSSPDYDQAVVGLREVYEAGKERLAPETVEVLEQSLAAIDQAIDEAKAAIAADPARDEVRKVLYNNMNRKLGVLRQAAAAVQDRT